LEIIKEGKIIFITNFNQEDNSFNINTFSLSDKKFRQYSGSESLREFKKYLSLPAQKKNLEKTDYVYLSPSGNYLSKFDESDFSIVILERNLNKVILKIPFGSVGPGLIKWSPNEQFIAYDYYWDKDDIHKMFVTNIRTGKTIVLAAGSDPIWVK
jgi:hypothetical protein